MRNFFGFFFFIFIENEEESFFFWLDSPLHHKPKYDALFSLLLGNYEKLNPFFASLYYFQSVKKVIFLRKSIDFLFVRIDFADAQCTHNNKIVQFDHFLLALEFNPFTIDSKEKKIVSFSTFSKSFGQLDDERKNCVTKSKINIAQQ